MFSGPKKACGIVLCSALFALAGCGSLIMGKVDTSLSTLKPGNFQLDPDHTRVIFKVSHLGISSFVGRFNRSDAQLNYRNDDPAASTFTADVDMTSLDINRPDFAETLMGCDWLCVNDYPKARFQSRGRAQVTGPVLAFSGDLTFRGVTKATTLTVTLNGATTNRLTGDYTLGVDAGLTLLRSEFGMGQFVPAVGDEVTLEIYAEFIRR
ncbi:YceI family protein [uncultured Gilvimarinus sp.]|uniref:YceI family protein n=1 Tax=uncultured Gilvimarinus sp. TaxID=1689143 RepID=UPI0030D9C967